MWILWKMRRWKCEFCEKWDFENVICVKNDILKMWILWKIRFWKCEFRTNGRFLPQCAMSGKWDFISDFHTLCFSLNETDGKKSIWIAVIVVWHTRHSSFYCWKKRSVLLSSTYRFTTKGSDCKALAMNFKNHQWLQQGTFSLSPSSAINDFLDFPTNL